MPFKQIGSICGALQIKAIVEFLYTGPYGKCCSVLQPYVVAMTTSSKAFTDELESYCKKNQVTRADLSPEKFKHILSENTHLKELFDNVQKKHKEFEQFQHDMQPVKNRKVEDVDIRVMENVANDIYTWCCQTRQTRGNLLYPIDGYGSFKINIFYDAYIVAHIGTPAALEWLDKYLQEEKNKNFASVCLCIAAETNNVALAELALKYGAQINQIRDILSDDQAYVRAIYYKRNFGFDHKHLQEVPFLTVQGETTTRIPLHIACLYSHKEMVQFLLERGADPSKARTA